MLTHCSLSSSFFVLRASAWGDTFGAAVQASGEDLSEEGLAVELLKRPDSALLHYAAETSPSK